MFILQLAVLNIDELFAVGVKNQSIGTILDSILFFCLCNFIFPFLLWNVLVGDFGACLFLPPI
jgi:hypothetical protein